MKPTTPEIKWLRGGTVHEVAWIGADTIGWCAGPYIVFYNVVKPTLSIPKFAGDDAARGGAACLSGHPTRKVFAFAGKATNPRIYIHAFPSLERLTVCSKMSSTSYLATAFANDYLVSLGSLPDFLITIWAWRTGEKLVSVHSSIFDAENFGQCLRTSYFPKTYIAQVGKVGGTLCIWEMIPNGEKTIMNKNMVKLPNRALVRDCAWRPDSTTDILAIVDRDGHIYISNPAGTEINRIVFSQRCATCTEIEPAGICWYRGGLVLRTTFCQIRYYQMDPETSRWSKLWYQEVKTEPTILTSHPTLHDRVYFFTKYGHIMQIDFDEDLKATFVQRYFRGGRFRFLSFLHPWNKHLVAVDNDNQLVVISAAEGARIAGIELGLLGETTCMVSHPDYPLMCLSTDKGEVAFISALHYNKPKILGRFLVQTEYLKSIKISKSGRYMIACDKERGVFYFFHVYYMEKIRLVTYLETNIKIADSICFDLEGPLKFIILQNTADLNPMIGHKMYIFVLNEETNEFEQMPTVFELAQCYGTMLHVPGDSNLFVAQPYLTKQLHFFKCQDWSDIVLTEMIPNGHNFRQIKMITNKRWIMTSSLNGTIVIRGQAPIFGKKQRPLLYPIQMMLITHQEKESAPMKITVDYSGMSILVLGHDGMIVNFESNELLQNLFRESDGEKASADDDKRHSHRSSSVRRSTLRRKRHLSSLSRKASLKGMGVAAAVDHEKVIAEYIRSMDHNLVEFLLDLVQPFSDDPNMTWKEWERNVLLEQERALSQEAKSAVVLEFSVLKKRVIELLDKNETVAETSQLPVSFFGLDAGYRERKLKAAKDDREEVRTRLEADIHERERVSNWIQEKLWNSQKVLFRSVFGIFDNTEITNYAVSREIIIDPDRIEWATYSRRVVAELVEDETVQPWDTRKPEQLKEVFEKQVKMIKAVDNLANFDNLDEEEEETEVKVDLDEERNVLLFTGLKAYNFIKMNNYYSQFRYYAFSQTRTDGDSAFNDEEKLRDFFNSKFDEIAFIKEREMSTMIERMERINFIIDELQGMFNENVGSGKLVFPQWHPQEKPENIIQVFRHEVSAEVYQSPSEVELLNKQKEEEENKRLARLDDFRERALMQMMDGVLEVRWEDLLKRDIPKPDVLVIKKPEDYTDDDKIILRKYEQEVKALEDDREHYRKTLQTDYTKISAALKDSIEKFNARIHEFLWLKMNVEAAIKQLEMRKLRCSMRHLCRLKDLAEVDNVKIQIKDKYLKVTELAEDLKTLKDIEAEASEYYENLNNKDKYMEKKMKNDFPTLGKVALDAITKQYKRRPKTVLRTVSHHEVTDLAKTITTQHKPPYLTSECLEYLKNLEFLDVRPTVLPPSIDGPVWESLIAIRRLKIAHELRIHAALLQLERTTQNIEILSKKLSEERASIESLKHYLVDFRHLRLERELDIETQLVLKYGQIEIKKFMGNVDEDTAGTVLLPRVTIEGINTVILAKGAKKVATVEKFLDFRKNIVFQKWEYSRLETKLRHIGTELYFTRTTNVTRTMQEILRRRSRKLKEDKTEKKMEKDFQLVRKRQEKVLTGWKNKLEETKKEIERLKRKNERMNIKIETMNVDRCELELQKDYAGEARQKRYYERVIKLTAERSSLLRKLLASYEELRAVRKEHHMIACGRGPPLVPIVDVPEPVECLCSEDEEEEEELAGQEEEEGFNV